MRPGSQVLTAFGVSADPVGLPGGQGITWRAGEIVLKPAARPAEARWTAELYRSLADRPGSGFRVPRPVRSVTGDWLGEGWVAWELLAGEPASWAGVPPRWPQLVAVSQAFHAALLGVPAPPWLGLDGTQWTVADQVAWGERAPAELLASGPDQPRGQVRALLAALRPVRRRSQLVHGDLGGNVLFAEGEPPAVIDFSPYWRPVGLAMAIAAVDALMWDGAHPAILDELAGEPDLDQLLARALITRLVTEIIARRAEAPQDAAPQDAAPQDTVSLDAVARAGEPVTDLVLARCAARPA